MKQALVLLSLLLLMACTSPHENMEKLVKNAGWKTQIIAAKNFDLLTARQEGRYSQTLWVYLEGDGNAYITRTTPSSDPTPPDPTALQLAIAHPTRDLVAYIGRPCQYVLPTNSRGCNQRYWTTARYAPEVIANINTVIDALKSKSQATNIVLVGYSGGGALAVLAAAQRHDVTGIITIAAPLDIAYWAQKNQLSVLQESQNPADVAKLVAGIPQTHFVGSEDKVITPDITRSYLSSMPQNQANILLIPQFTHKCCWVKKWPELLTSTLVMQQ